MDLKLEIRRNADGVIATDVWPNWTWHVYWWKDGNARCDCNRELFFCRARDEDEPEEAGCGETRYSVRCSGNDTGEVLYSEF